MVARRARASKPQALRQVRNQAGTFGGARAVEYWERLRRRAAERRPQTDSWRRFVERARDYFASPFGPPPAPRRLPPLRYLMQPPAPPSSRPVAPQLRRWASASNSRRVAEELLAGAAAVAAASLVALGLSRLPTAATIAIGRCRVASPTLRRSSTIGTRSAVTLWVGGVSLSSVGSLRRHDC